jgi:M6 family metalloprotease-like protein
MQKYLIVLLTLTLIVVNVPAHSKNNSHNCKKINKIRVVEDKTYKCTKTKKSLKWKLIQNEIIKESNIPKFEFTTPCDKDPEVPTEWVSIQEFSLKTFHCARPYRYVKFISNMPKNTDKPSTNVCKPDPVSSDRIKFNKELNIQVLPIKFLDVKVTTNPNNDYSKYFDFIKNYYENTSDTSLNIKIRVPNEYITIEKNIDSYELNSYKKYLNTPFGSNLGRLSKDVYEKVYNTINFSDIDLVIIVVPPTLSGNEVMKMLSFDQILTKSGKVISNTFLAAPPNAIDIQSFFGIEPNLWVHEIAHFAGLDDHYGNANNNPATVEEVGTGSWGLMSRLGSDFLIWDKWISGLVSDNQIVCINDLRQEYKYWLNASTIKGETDKAIIIKVNNKKIVIESIRPYGYNYKIPVNYSGVLIYVVDSSIKKHGFGISVIPKSSFPIKDSKGFILPNATYRAGDSVNILGININIIESNVGGDLISIR